MAKIKQTPRRPPETQPARKQPEKQPRSSAPLPALATDDSPSRRTRSFAASNEEKAIHDNSFHSDPGQDEIKYSDNESEHTNNTDDAEEANGDGEDDDEYEDTHDEEENFDNTDDDDDNCNNDYSELVDSSLLEDEELSVSYRVDWVKGKGAGRKPNKGRPPRSH